MVLISFNQLFFILFNLKMLLSYVKEHPRTYLHVSTYTYVHVQRMKLRGKCRVRCSTLYTLLDALDFS